MLGRGPANFQPEPATGYYPIAHFAPDAQSGHSAKWPLAKMAFQSAPAASPYFRTADAPSLEPLAGGIGLSAHEVPHNAF